MENKIIDLYYSHAEWDSDHGSGSSSHMYSVIPLPLNAIGIKKTMPSNILEQGLYYISSGEWKTIPIDNFEILGILGETLTSGYEYNSIISKIEKDIPHLLEKKLVCIRRELGHSVQLNVRVDNK